MASRHARDRGASRSARDEGLVAAGELALACYAYYGAVVDPLDCVPSLEAYVAEVEGAAAYVRRTGNEQVAQSFESYLWLAGVLTGETQDRT